jgi:GNAT superfamily N-acetyltransferase
MVVIQPLAQHPSFLRVAVLWFEAEWPEYFATQTPGAAERTFQATDQTWLAASIDGEPVGVIALRPYPITDEPEFSPALGGLYVAPSFRRRGVGEALIEAACDLARRKGVERLHLSTIPARTLVERLGWTQIAEVQHAGSPHPIFARELG